MRRITSAEVLEHVERAPGGTTRTYVEALGLGSGCGDDSLVCGALTYLRLKGLVRSESVRIDGALRNRWYPIDAGP